MNGNKSDDFVGLSRKHLSLSYSCFFFIHFLRVRHIWEKQIYHHGFEFELEMEIPSSAFEVFYHHFYCDIKFMNKSQPMKGTLALSLSGRENGKKMENLGK
jgi:hypothetical protein